MSKEQKKKQSERMKGRIGKDAMNWKGGISTVKGYHSFYGERHRARKMGALGCHTSHELKEMKPEYGFTCPCCKKSEPDIQLTEDHIIPLSQGGSDFIENIQPLCRSCNGKKYTKTIKFIKQ